MKSSRSCFQFWLNFHNRKYVTATQPDVEQPRRLQNALRYLKLNSEIAEALDQGILKPRHHPGIMKSHVQTLPTTLLKAIDRAVEGVSKRDITSQGEKISRILQGRHIPRETSEINNILSNLKERLRSSIQDHSALLSEDVESSNSVRHLENRLAMSKLKQLVHPWKLMDYDRNTCLMYLVSRTPAEFVILHKIFSEINIRDPDFVPRTFFDFGSGLASGFWALREVWSKPLLEAFHVDTSIHMNDLANEMIKENIQDTASLLGLFFRQFLPGSPEKTYDLVLSGFSLLELPTLENRIETVFNLWEKTNNYLVIVEDGTKAGYNVIMEARNLILELSKHDKEECHVFAPCPHELECPQIAGAKQCCNFDVKYYSLPYLTNKRTLKSHRYSYVVLKRGSRMEDLKWPRCVYKSISKSRVVFSKVCTSDGKLADAVISKGKNDVQAYNCAKHTRWGDLLPGELFKSEEDMMNQE